MATAPSPARDRNTAREHELASWEAVGDRLARERPELFAHVRAAVQALLAGELDEDACAQQLRALAGGAA